MRNFRHIVRMSKSRSGLFAQLIGESGDTIIGMRFVFDKSKKVSPVEQCGKYGKDFAAAVIKKKIKEISFDRNGNIYCGRIKSFAEGMREEGLIF